MERLADQAFSVGLLIAAVLWMVKRQNEERMERQKLQDKFDQYMENDRRQLMDVIQNNTRVMERIEDHLDRK